MRKNLDGVLIIDKPPGTTSAGVVARVKRATGAERVGHAGTLDPMATGVLPLCLETATKLAGYLLAADKAYEGELLLGVETDTLDREGTIVTEQRERASAVTAAELRAVAAAMLGPGLQVPPMFSAIRQGGRRLHELARAGHTVAREPRPIEIRALEVTAFESPRARFSIECSKGTYVRSVVSDLGSRLGCGAHLTELRRTRSGGFGLSQACTLAQVEEAGVPADRLIGLADAVAHLPAFRIDESYHRHVADGRQLPWTELSDEPQPLGICRLLGADGDLLAIARVSPAGTLAYERVLRSRLTRTRRSYNLPAE
jgi:tRNA pseudouridine55 synthase